MRIFCGLLFVGILTARAQGPTFAAASVKPFEWGGVSLTQGGPIQVRQNQAVLHALSLKEIVAAVYNVEDYQVVDEPYWADRLMWDIQAKASGDSALSLVQARAMLRSLLAERFHLKVRLEPRGIAVYHLEVAEGGLKIKESSPGLEFSGIVRALQGTGTGRCWIEPG